MWSCPRPLVCCSLQTHLVLASELTVIALVPCSDGVQGAEGRAEGEPLRPGLAGEAAQIDARLPRGEFLCSSRFHCALVLLWSPSAALWVRVVLAACVVCALRSPKRCCTAGPPFLITVSVCSPLHRRAVAVWTRTRRCARRSRRRSSRARWTRATKSSAPSFGYLLCALFLILLRATFCVAEADALRVPAVSCLCASCSH